MTPQILQDTGEKASYREAVHAVREKCSLLEASGPVKGPLDHAIEIADTAVASHNAAYLESRSWRPPLFALAEDLTQDELLAFDSGIRTVLAKSGEHPNELSGWLNECRPEQWDIWRGKLFDLSLKVQLCGTPFPMEFDKALAGGNRNIDVSVSFPSRLIRIEATAHCKSKEQREIEREREGKLRQDDGTASRPAIDALQSASYDDDEESPPNRKEPLQDYQRIRFYLKVYEKLAKGLDPRRTQFDGTVPTVLAINLPESGNIARRGVKTGVEELFSEGRRDGAWSNCLPDGRLDDTLGGWINHHASNLIGAGELASEEYIKWHTELMAAPMKISAIVVFERYTFSFSRINYNALSSCVLTHADMAQLDELFSMPPPTWTRRMVVGPE